MRSVARRAAVVWLHEGDDGMRGYRAIECSYNTISIERTLTDQVSYRPFGAYKNGGCIVRTRGMSPGPSRQARERARSSVEHADVVLHLPPAWPVWQDLLRSLRILSHLTAVVRGPKRLMQYIVMLQQGEVLPDVL